MTSGESSVRAFLDAYRAAFEAFDVAAIASLFSYPCHITSGAPDVTVTPIPDRDVWVAQVEQLLGAYRAIGVRAAEVLTLHVVELTARLAQGAVRWRLLDESGGPIYDFDASYALADFGEGMRITAVAHNEAPRLLAAIERWRQT